MPAELQQEKQKAQIHMLSPATKKAVELFGKVFKRPGELSSINKSIEQLNKAPQSQWDKIIQEGSDRFFNPNQREAARKILRTQVYENSLEFSALGKDGRPSNIRTELRLPDWAYSEGKLTTLRSHLQDGLTVSDALKAVGIPENLVKTYRIYQNGKRRKANLDIIAGKTLPGPHDGYGDVRARINKPKYD